MLDEKEVTEDERLRRLERATGTGDELAARELLSLLLRTGEHQALADRLEPTEVLGRSVLGPLFAHEVERLLEVEPAALSSPRSSPAVEGGRGGWLKEEYRGAYGALLRLRSLELERIAETAPEREASILALHVTLGVFGTEAIERLACVVRDAPPWAALRAAGVLAERPEPAAAVVLARVALEAPAEARGRAYRALARGRVPLEQARPLLAQALAREKPELRPFAFVAFLREAPDQDLRRLRREGPPDVRAQAFEALAIRAAKLARGNNRPVELVREALADPAAELRRAAVRILAGREWERDPRAQSWLMGRLLDADRTVRVEALRLLRRRELPARVAPRLRTIAHAAPPSLRSPIERLAERVEK